MPDTYDKRRVREAFERAAATYDACAALQREVADQLLERLELVRLTPQRILDVGAGTGYCTAALAARYPQATIIAIDLAPAMLHRARARLSGWQRWRRGHAFIAADAEQLPFAAGSFDLIFSSLTLQWCNGLDPLYRGLARVLRPGGLLQFATLGPDTLKELRGAWAAADPAVHVNQFIDMHEVGDALIRARLADPVLDTERLVVTYQEVAGLMRDLKGIGAHNINTERPAGLTGKGRLKAMLAAYEQQRTASGRIPATYEVVYGHAFGTEPAVQAPAAQAPGAGWQPLLPRRRG